MLPATCSHSASLNTTGTDSEEYSENYGGHN